MEKWYRLKMALRAFLVIASGRHHAYSDDKRVSILGSYNEMDRYLVSMVELYNDEAYQANTLREAKEVLNQ